MATLDIMINYTRLTATEVEDIANQIDDPSNGFMLGLDLHYDFDNFEWCLEPTDVSRPY